MNKKRKKKQKNFSYTLGRVVSMVNVKEYNWIDFVRSLMVSIVGIILFLTIIGIPIALMLMQLERIIQMLGEVKK